MHSADHPDGLVVADADERVIEFNPAAERLLGVSYDDAIGAPLSQVMHIDDHKGRYWYSCLKPYTGLSTRTRFTEGLWYSANGDELLVTALLRREEPHGPVTKVVVSLRDAKPRARLDRERSDMVATVAHELRSPLTGVKGFTSTLLRKWDRFSDEQRQFMLETVDADADRLSRLITELLDAARIDSGRLTLRTEPINPAELVQRVLDNVSAGIGERLRQDIAAPMPVIWGDSDRITQVVTNIVENALTHGRGIRAIRLREADDDGVLITVSDHGPGIPEDERARVFHRFWKGGQGAGSGLGMYIVKGVIDQHQGSVQITDGAEGGSEITIWLPTNEPTSLSD